MDNPWNTTVAIHYAQELNGPPYLNHCARKYGKFYRHSLCANPGLDVELTEVVLRYLNFTPAVSMMPLSSFQDILQNLGVTLDMWGGVAQLDSSEGAYLPSPPVIYPNFAVLTTDRPTSANVPLLSMLQPFSWQLWLILGAFWLTQRVYANIIMANVTVGLRIRRFRPTFRANLVPISFLAITFAVLYRSRLLTRLLFRSVEYQIQSTTDLVRLPMTVDIVGAPSNRTWVEFVKIVQDPYLRAQLEQRMARNVHETNLTMLMEEIRSGEAVLFTSSITAHYMNALCDGVGTRVYEFLNENHQKFNFAFKPRSTRQLWLSRQVDRAVSAIRPMINTILRRYERSRPEKAALDCGLCDTCGEKETTFTNSDGNMKISLEYVKGIMLMLLCALVCACAVLLVEILRDNLLRRSTKCSSR